ncbi:MAG: hypothetical protein COC03_07750 [Robiginitomaculum sp.]|nr:MAG: hypothetical protein COC03_07750 [Robiginitomaculum sp.]
MTRFKLIIFDSLLLIVVIILGWLLIASAADFFVMHFIRSKWGYYTAHKYVNDLGLYVVLNIIFITSLNFFASIRPSFVAISRAIFVVTFLLFTFFFIEDDINYGRPIIPEIVFIISIALFQLLLMKLITKLRSINGNKP